MNSLSLRNEVIEYAEKHYNCTAEYPWYKFPNYAVIRHSENQKWFALFMTVPKSKLHLDGDGYADILNIKVQPLLGEMLCGQKGFLPPYHQKAGSWITVLLDGSVDMEEIKYYLEMSYNLTLPKSKITNPDYRNTRWIVPANPKYYDIDKAVKESKDGTIIWKQSNRILVGDTVYIYVASPVSQLRFRCEAVEVNIPYRYSNENVKMSYIMRLKILQTYDKTPIGFDLLKQYGVTAIRGPRSIPKPLEDEIQRLYNE